MGAFLNKKVFQGPRWYVKFLTFVQGEKKL